MRKVLWNTLHERNSIDYERIVQEFPLLGSRFTPRGGYFTADDVCISRTMRMKVMEVKNDYANERKDQEERVRTSRMTQQPPTAVVHEQTMPRPLIPGRYLEEPLDVRSRPRTLQNRPPTPYTEDHSVWEPALNTSDPNYVPRRPMTAGEQRRLNNPRPKQQVTSGRAQPCGAGN